MLRLVPALAVAVTLTGCADSFDEDLKAVQEAPYLSTGGTTTPTTGASPTTGSGIGSDGTMEGSGTGSGGETTGAVATTGADTGASTASGEGDTSSSGTSGGALPPPAILDVDMPAKVALAGPVPFTTTTEYAISARATLDGVDIGALQDEGAGVFSGAVAIHGSVDNGAHVLEVIAEREGLSDHRPVPFVVSTPAAGTVAWAMAGPGATRTRRIALTPARDVIEIGSWAFADVQRPAIRKRSGITGAELWAGGTLLLDYREGWATDIAVAPDGRLWVAMNVREAVNVWRPRMMLLDASGNFTGVEVPTEAGQTVSGIDNDGTGGCVAVGFGGSGKGDMDVLIWRMNGDHVPVMSGKTWDYQPNFPETHTFTELATDVVVQGDVAWIVGLTSGKHDELKDPHNRGFILRMDIDTAAVLGPVIIAPQSGAWTQSMLFGATAHPDGVLVTGNACNDVCDAQRVETALYTAAGARTWFKPEKTSTTAYGTDVALNAHGGVVVAATMRDGTALRGFILGRVVYNAQAEPFSVPFPASKEDSEASGVAIDAFDRVFAGGYRTVGGVMEARAVLAHP
jgi:hypothetical protein